MIGHFVQVKVLPAVVVFLAWGSSVIGGSVYVVTQDATNFVVSFSDVVTLAGFITGPPTLIMLGAWRHLYGRIDKLDKRFNEFVTTNISKEKSK